MKGGSGRLAIRKRSRPNTKVTSSTSWRTSAPGAEVRQLVLLVTFVFGLDLFRIASLPEPPFIEERFALPDLLHDFQRFAHHLVQERRVLAALDPVDIRR